MLADVLKVNSLILALNSMREYTTGSTQEAQSKLRGLQIEVG